jgi:hypothetical protein
MLDNYFKTTSKKCVTNVEPKNEHAGIGENLIAVDSSSSSTLRGERRKNFREGGLKKFKNIHKY